MIRPELSSAALCLLVAACHAAPPPASTRATSESAPTPAAQAADAEKPKVTDRRFVEHPVWVAAAKGDPMDLARLANLEGTVGLLEGVAAGGKIQSTSLAALPHAPDAEAALSVLCGRLDSDTPVGPTLRAIHEIVSRPPADGETLEAWTKGCRAALVRLSKSSELSPSELDLAASALRMISEHEPAPKP